MKLNPYAENTNLSKYPKDYVVVDLETTGLSPSSDEIIEIGAIKVINLEVVDSFSTLVKPSSNIPLEITGITGISDKTVRSAPQIEKAIKQFIAFAGSMPLVGHNIDNFDVKFLRYAYGRIGKSFSNETFDTLTLAKRLISGSYKLGSLAEAFKIKVKRSHRALDDCETTNKLYLALVDLAVEHSTHPETIAKWTQTDSRAGALSGVNVVFTGLCDEYSRKDLIVLSIKNGGTVQSDVTLKTNILVRCDERVSSKVKKAQSYEDRSGIETIWLDEFLYLVEHGSRKRAKKRPVKKPIKAPVKEAVEKTTKEPVKEAVKEPVKEAVKKQVIKKDAIKREKPQAPINHDAQDAIHSPIVIDYSKLYESCDQQIKSALEAIKNTHEPRPEQEYQEAKQTIYSRKDIKPVRSRFKITLAIITTVVIAIFFLFNLLMAIFGLYGAVINLDGQWAIYLWMAVIFSLCDAFCAFVMYKLIRYAIGK